VGENSPDRRVFLQKATALIGAGSLLASGPKAFSATERTTARPRLGRTAVSLTGQWNYRPIARTTLHSDGSISEDKSNLPPAGRMAVPSNWHLSGLPNFNGRVLFERDFNFTHKLSPDDRVFLVFYGVDYFSKVALNGTTIGDHEGYFQRFEFDVTRHIMQGSNHLAVTVDAPLEEPGTVWPNHKRMIKGVFSHWDCKPGSTSLEHGQDGTTAGIWNRVELEIRNSAWLDEVKIQPFLYKESSGEEKSAKNQTRAKVFIAAEITAVHPGEYLITAEAGGSSASSQVKISDGTASAVLVLPIDNPRLWWTWDLGEPYLYNCRLTLSFEGSTVDVREIPFGIRTIELDERTGEWRLNGVRFFIRGSSIVPDLWLSHYTPERIDEDIQWLKQAHMNGVRVCVHMNRQELYDALDRAGIVAWQDFPLQWDYTHTDTFLQEAARQLRDMIRQFYNHPSIITWVCQNESSAYNVEVMDPFLAQVGKQEDSSRPVRPVSAFSEHLYLGWYSGDYHGYLALPGGPIISELGAQALPSVDEVRDMAGDAWPPDWEKLAYHDFQYDQTFHVARVAMGNNWQEFVQNSQQYQARLLKFAIEHYRRAKYKKVGCFFQFMFMDCWPAITWSVLSYARKPKAGYHAVAHAFQPVLVGADLSRIVWSKGKLGRTHTGAPSRQTIRPWVVNDRIENVEGVTCEVSLCSQGRGQIVGRSDAPVNLAADSVSDLPPIQCTVPEDLDNGPYELIVTLRQAGKPLSENSYEVTVVD